MNRVESDLLKTQKAPDMLEYTACVPLVSLGKQSCNSLKFSKHSRKYAKIKTFHEVKNLKTNRNIGADIL